MYDMLKYYNNNKTIIDLFWEFFSILPAYVPAGAKIFINSTKLLNTHNSFYIQLDVRDNRNKYYKDPAHETI